MGSKYTTREFPFDPWRAQQAALELEREGLTCVVWPQTYGSARPRSASRAVVEQRITLPDHPKRTSTRPTRWQGPRGRGWRLDSPAGRVNRVIALMMALDRCDARPQPVRFLRWL